MSETDDTDELLLIPPDFFLTHPALSENLGPYFGVVDSLITQVNYLEDRINTIEITSEISNSSEMNSPPRYRKYSNEEKVYSASAQNTPQKPKTKFTMNSLPNSPDVDKVRRPAKKAKEVGPMLSDIDSFLSNVKTIKRLNTVRNLEGDFNSSEDGRTKSLDLKQVDEMLKEMELKQRKSERPIVKETAWRCGDNVDSVPDYGYGMRKNMYTDSQHTQTDTSCDKNESDSSSESTQVTAFDRYQCRKNVEKNINVNSDRNYGLGLVSLSKLWNSNDVKENPSKFQQQLQEERLRRQIFRSSRRLRSLVTFEASVPPLQKSSVFFMNSCFQHCEQAIQELQNRVLELQERVAVAIQVDEAKDKAILKLHESWERTGGRINELEKEKRGLEEEVDKLRKRVNDGSEESLQKVARYEQEASKALNLAHVSQEKLAAMEKKCSELENELRTAEINSEEFQKKYMVEVEKNRQYPELLAQKELELNDCKTVLAEARKEVSQSKKAVEICQSELMSMRKDNESLQTKLETEKENVKKLNEQKGKLLEEINAHKSISRGLQEELSKTREQLENNKIELKNFYQGQVELVVQNKLKEFQKQLDDAEKALKEELSKKELSIAKTAASHIQQISEKHTLEIRLLEEKHQEECRLYQLQIEQMRHELEEASQKIKRQHEKHVHIEKQLHRFMESLRQDHVTTLDEMNSFRSKSFNSLEEILAFNMAEEERNRKQEEYKMAETPLTSRGEKDRGARRKENTLQETIQMLLDKKGQGDGRGYDEHVQQAMRDGGASFYQRLGKDGKGKPPWK